MIKINVNNALLFFLCLFTTLVNAATIPPYLATSDCPDGYKLMNGFCFYEQARFSVDSKTVFTTMMLKEESTDQIKPVHAYALSVKILATMPGVKNQMPVAALPVTLSSAYDQSVHLFDETQGQFIKRTWPAKEELPLTTNDMGKVTLFFPLFQKEDYLMKPMLIKAPCLADSKGVLVDEQSPLLNAMATLDDKAIQAINPSLSAQDALKLKENIGYLMNAVKQTAPRMTNEDDFSNQVGENQENLWEKLQREGIKHIQVLGDKITQTVQLLIQTHERVVKMVIDGVRAALQALIHLLESVSLPLRKVLDAVNKAWNVEDIKQTHVFIVEYLARKSEELDFDTDNRGLDWWIHVLKDMVAFGVEPLNRLIDAIRGNGHGSDGSVKTQGLSDPFVADAVIPGLKSLPVSDKNGQLRASIDKELADVEKKLSGLDSDEVKPVTERIVALREQVNDGPIVELVINMIHLVQYLWEWVVTIFPGLPGIVTVIVSGFILRMIKLILVIPIPLDGVRHWPFINLLDDSLEPNLLTLTTLVPAIVFTYLYKLGHDGKAPFASIPYDGGENSNTITDLSAMTTKEMNKEMWLDMMEKTTQTMMPMSSAFDNSLMMAGLTMMTMMVASEK